MTKAKAQGPLAGLKVVEFAGIGPAPMCAMLLADLGADVLRVDRLQDAGLGIDRRPEFDLLNRGRRSAAIDLKQKDGVAAALRLVARADVLIEGFRPGVMERMGLGPDVCLAKNPGLVYGRMTGWGQTGPLAQAAGHDLNYIALIGALHAIGGKEKPVPPLNLVGDFGGGALYLAFGICAALYERQRSGKGQVIDAAMTDGAASLAALFYGLFAQGIWRDQRGANILDGAAPFYDTYETKDGKFVAIAPIEAKFYAEFLAKLGIDPASLPKQNDAKRWPETKARFAAAIKAKSRDEWCRILEGSDACFAPVLSLAEAPKHPHNAARGTFIEVAGVVQPGPAPRFDRTPGAVQGPPPAPGAHTAEGLADWGFSEAEIAALKTAGVAA
ncbi:MAG: CaiB/BaiF CoA-transferase family protein [Alphaproteobacteria bacterium]